MNKLLSFLFLRFVPHRTAVGVGLFLAAEFLGVLNTDTVCSAMPAVCAFAAKAQTVLTPWLVLAGIRDRDRK